MKNTKPALFRGVENRARWLLIGVMIMVARPLAAEVRLNVLEGRLVVDGVYVNGHGPYRFLVDTGTNVNLIETDLARRIGVNATFQVDLVSAAGRAVTPGADGNEVVFDSLKADGQRFLLSRLDAVHDLLPGVRGVLGQQFLSRFDYFLDFKHQRLEFGKQERSGMRVRFTALNGRAAVSTNLGDLILDSGVTRLVLFGVKSGGGNSARGLMKTLAGSQVLGTASRNLVIESRNVWTGSAVTMLSRTEPGVGGLLPASFFKTIYVCNSEGYVIFE
jgi:hypothetical protein